MGQRALDPEILRPQKLTMSGSKNGPIFSVCGPKFTKFDRHLREWSQYAALFSSHGILSSAIKSQSGVVENYDFRPTNFWGEGPPKSDVDILCPYRDTSGRKVWCNFPDRSRRYKPKYTIFLANFRISGVKKLLGQTHPQWGVH